MGTEELAKAAYDTWDAYGGRALGNWSTQYTQEAWVAVVNEIREALTEADPETPQQS